METKELPLKFVGVGEVKGDLFEQVEKTSFGYIYKRTFYDGGCCYEVFKHRENKMFGNISYPKSKAFGVWAWCCSTYEHAKRRLNQLEK